MKKIRAILASVLTVATLSLLLTSCAEQGKTLKVYNWGDYMDREVLEIVEKETGIKIIYDEYETNEDMYLKLKHSGGSSYDVCFPSDYMITKMVNEDMLAELDFANIPNYQNVSDQFKSQPFDPDNQYSVPYMWGTVCIAYDPNVVDEPVNDWNVLWDEAYSRKIFMINSERDSIGVALMSLGYSINTKDMDQLEMAKTKLLEQKPLILSYTGDDVKDKMSGGEGSLAVMWSCDVGFVRAENPNIKFVIPDTGTNIWYDNVVILKNAEHKTEAEQFINFLCRPDIAAMNREYLDSSSPIQQVIDELPDEIRNDPVYYPPAELWEKSEVFENLSDMAGVYETIWSDVVAG